MDGHTKKGAYEVTLKLTGDQVMQLQRLVQLGKMMNGRDFDMGQRPEKLDVLAYRAFLEEILQVLYKSIEGKS